MTYDTQGRRVLQGHPSRWEDECRWQSIRAQQAIDEAKALRAENERLRAALRDVIGMLDDPTGGEHVRDMRGATVIARAALKATTAPHSATHSAKSGPGKGQTPETP